VNRPLRSVDHKDIRREKAAMNREHLRTLWNRGKQ